MFLKTGVYIDFEFKIIPIDVLSEIIVTNLLNDKQNKGESFIRPLLPESVTDVLLSNTVANILGMKRGDPATLRELFYSKPRFDFMIPDNFYELLAKVNILHAVMPESLKEIHMPSTPMLFLSNLNRILSQKNETEMVN